MNGRQTLERQLTEADPFPEEATMAEDLARLEASLYLLERTPENSSLADAQYAPWQSDGTPSDLSVRCKCTYRKRSANTLTHPETGISFAYDYNSYHRQAKLAEKYHESLDPATGVITKITLEVRPGPGSRQHLPASLETIGPGDDDRTVFRRRLRVSADRTEQNLSAVQLESQMPKRRLRRVNLDVKRGVRTAGSVENWRYEERKTFYDIEEFTYEEDAVRSQQTLTSYYSAKMPLTKTVIWRRNGSELERLEMQSAYDGPEPVLQKTARTYEVDGQEYLLLSAVFYPRNGRAALEIVKIVSAGQEIGAWTGGDLEPLTRDLGKKRIAETDIPLITRLLAAKDKAAFFAA